VGYGIFIIRLISIRLVPRLRYSATFDLRHNRNCFLCLIVLLFLALAVALTSISISSSGPAPDMSSSGPNIFDVFASDDDDATDDDKSIVGSPLLLSLFVSSLTMKRILYIVYSILWI
jgi:hypothetical protein